LLILFKSLLFGHGNVVLVSFPHHFCLTTCIACKSSGDGCSNFSSVEALAQHDDRIAVHPFGLV
jgi:hypothetical protein